MQILELTPAPENFPLGRPAAPIDVSVRWDPSLFTTAPATPVARAAGFVAEHDASLVLEALGEIERKRLALETLLDEDLFRICL